MLGIFLQCDDFSPEISYTMVHSNPCRIHLLKDQWPTALAPMQDVTGLPFMTVVARRGAPDFFFTEFFRVHAQLQN